MKIMLVKDRNVLNTKFLVQFANSLTDLGHDVHIACYTYGKIGSGVFLDKKVTVSNLNEKCKSPLVNIIRRFREKIPYFAPKVFAKFIRREKPDVVLCYFIRDLYNVLHNQKHNCPIIMMHHKYPPTIIEKLEKKRAKRQSDYRDMFENADAHQVLMKSFEKTIADKYQVKKIVTIPNEVTQIDDNKLADLKAKKIIYVGRISRPGKRQHYLIEAFSKIAQEFPDWSLEFWGLSKYPQYDAELKNMIVDHGLEKQVFLRGFSNDINKIYQSASINAFPSAHEGFGLGLADGMAHGMPAVGFSTTPAVNELIQDGKSGFLVNNIDEFSEALKKLMQDESLRMSMGRQAREDMKRYDPEKIISQWGDFLRSLIKD